MYMQQYVCGECGQLRSADDPGATFEDVISLDKRGQFIGATRVMTCGACVRRKKPVVVETADKKTITVDQKRLF